MSYKGLMDGWNGDEYECNGTCGHCEYCDNRYDQICDEEYEHWCEEIDS